MFAFWRGREGSVQVGGALAVFSFRSRTMLRVVSGRTVPAYAASSKPVFLLSRARYSASSNQPRILVTGGLGQIGVELVSLLRAKYGRNNVITSDVRKPEEKYFAQGPFEYADVCNYASLERLIVEHRISWLVHNSSILSATGERDPSLALKVNVDGLHNVLELARRHSLRILAPSSIAGMIPRLASKEVAVMSVVLCWSLVGPFTLYCNPVYPSVMECK
jgi:threonine 3-dehydrogenase